MPRGPPVPFYLTASWPCIEAAGEAVCRSNVSTTLMETRPYGREREGQRVLGLVACPLPRWQRRRVGSDRVLAGSSAVLKYGSDSGTGPRPRGLPVPSTL